MSVEEDLKAIEAGLDRRDAEIARLRAEVERLEAERDSLRAKLLSAPEPWLDTKKIMVSDGTRDVTLHGEKYVNWYAANVAPLREGK